MSGGKHLEDDEVFEAGGEMPRATDGDNQQNVVDLFIRGDHVEVAQRLARRLRSNGAPCIADEGEVWRYSFDRRVYEVVDRADQSRIVQSFAGSPMGDGKILKLKSADVSGAMKLAFDQLVRPNFFAEAPHGIAFDDCFVSVDPNGIAQRRHGAEHRVRFAYPFPFRDSALPQRWLGYLDEVFRGDDDRDEKIALLQEFVGVSMLGLAPRYGRATVLLGAGANGKSVFMEIVAACMPPGSMCSVPPHEWGHEYKAALLAGKRINIVAELPRSEILSSESFKAVVTGDSVVARQIRESPFCFRPVAGHLFSANALPGTGDQTHGFWRRFQVVSFNRVFADHEQDRNLASELIAKELPAIVRWFIEGARNLLARGQYTQPPSSEAVVTHWRRTSDQVRAWVDECTERLPPSIPDSVWTPARDLYAAYRTWAEDNGHRPLASNSFGERLGMLGIQRAEKRDCNRYPLRIRLV